VGHTSLDGNTSRGDITEFKGVVRRGKNGVSKVLTYFVFIDIEGSNEIDIAYVITPQVNMHKPGHKFIFLGVLIIMHALKQG
jgi:hypothetical protein